MSIFSMETTKMDFFYSSIWTKYLRNTRAPQVCNVKYTDSNELKICTHVYLQLNGIELALFHRLHTPHIRLWTMWTKLYTSRERFAWFHQYQSSPVHSISRIKCAYGTEYTAYEVISSKISGCKRLRIVWFIWNTQRQGWLYQLLW